MAAYTTIDLECAREGIDPDKVRRVIEHVHLADEDDQLLPDLAQSEAARDEDISNAFNEGRAERSAEWVSAAEGAEEYLAEGDDPKGAIIDAFKALLPNAMDRDCVKDFIKAARGVLDEIVSLPQAEGRSHGSA